MRPACALFAVHGVLDAARTVAEALPALSARVGEGVQSAALAVRGEEGVVAVAPDARRPGPDLRGVADTALVRMGGDAPMVFADRSGAVAVVADGRATNAVVLRGALMARGALFAGESLAELLIHLVAQSERRTFMNRMLEALPRIEGGFAVVVLTGEFLVAARDVRGLRPLCIGRRGGGWVVASEGGALRASGASYEREVEPGEVVVVEGAQLQSLRPFPKMAPRPCVAEWLGLAAPDARVFGVDVVLVRERMGAALAEAFPVRCDLVVPMPGSEALAAGFAAKSQVRALPCLVGDVSGQMRASAGVHGQRVALLVNLFASGERTRRAVAALRVAGAAEVHIRLGAMPLIGSCVYGVVGPPTDDLLGNRFEIPRMRAWLDADSLAHPERTTVHVVVGHDSTACCDGCFSGDYPVVPLDPQIPLFPKPASVW